MAQNLNTKLKGAICYGNKTTCKDYGKLYTWEQALRACPKGWKLPTWEDWEKLNDLFEYRSLVDQYRFDEQYAFGGLYRGRYELKDDVAAYWTKSELDDEMAWSYQIDKRRGALLKLDEPKNNKLSCRCIKK